MCSADTTIALHWDAISVVDSRTRHVSLLGVKPGSHHYRLFIYVSFGGDTIKAVDPFYLVSIPGEVKYPRHAGVNTAG